MKAAITCFYEGSEISIKEAIDIRENSSQSPFFTCTYCAEPLRAHKAGKNSGAHFEHHERNYSCPFSEGKRRAGDCFPIDDPRAIEGYALDRKILSGSRNTSLANQRKFKDNYTCQACDFRLKLNGRYVIECHHKFPLGDGAVRETTLDHLVSLCPTCHRIAHTSKEPLDIPQIVEARKNL